MVSFKPFQVDYNLPIVCINCYGRSGSVLLQSLLDGHPQLISMPAHTFVIPQARQELLLFLSKGLKGKSIPQIIEETMYFFPYLFRETDQTPVLRSAAALSTVGVPRDSFAKVLGHILKAATPEYTEPRVFFRAIHYAYHISLGRDVSDLKAIIWQRHTPFGDDRVKGGLIQNLGSVKFLVPVRRPDVTLSSHFDAKNFDGDKPSLIRDIPALIEQLPWAGRVHDTYVPYSAAVRFEDVHRQTEKVTRAIAEWIGADWHPNMLEPTLDGGEMLFPKGDTFIRGFNPDIEKKQSAKHFSWFDKLVFAAFNYHAYEKWGYQPIRLNPLTRKFIRMVAVAVPLKMEMIQYKNDLRSGTKVFTALRFALTRRKETYKNDLPPMSGPVDLREPGRFQGIAV